MVSDLKPEAALRVADLPRSLGFYIEGLKFALVEHDEAAGTAIVDAVGYPILLAGPIVDDPAAWLEHPQALLQPGASLHVFGGDLDARRETLRRRDVTATLVERSWGDRELRVPDPDGYTVVFWTMIERTPEEVLALYAAGVEALNDALAGLSDADLDLTSKPGEWSIRQIVHHLADSEATVLAGLKFALAEPGRRYIRNGYHQDVWAEGLDYAGRPIGPAVALFGAIRAHLLQLVRHIPGAWERNTVDAEGQPGIPVGQYLGMLASHALEHIEEIRETRAVHGR